MPVRLSDICSQTLLSNVQNKINWLENGHFALDKYWSRNKLLLLWINMPVYICFVFLIHGEMGSGQTAQVYKSRQ